MTIYSKKEHEFFYTLSIELKKIGKLNLKMERQWHMGLRHESYTSYVLYYKKSPILYLEYIHEHSFRKMIKFRDIIESNRNVYVIFENSNISQEMFYIIKSTDIRYFDKLLLEDFTIEDILIDNYVQLSFHTLAQLESNIKKINKVLDMNT